MTTGARPYKWTSSIRPVRDDADTVFSRIVAVALFSPARSNRYRKWLKARHVAGLEFHHACGSKHGIKSTDHLAVMVRPGEHREGQRDRRWMIEQVPQAIQNLLAYVKDLEEQTDTRRKR